jgi:hypothetical protein
MVGVTGALFNQALVGTKYVLSPFFLEDAGWQFERAGA